MSKTAPKTPKAAKPQVIHPLFRVNINHVSTYLIIEECAPKALARAAGIWKQEHPGCPIVLSSTVLQGTVDYIPATKEYEQVDLPPKA